MTEEVPMQRPERERIGRARQLLTDAINRTYNGEDAEARKQMREAQQILDGCVDEEAGFR